MIKRHPLLSLFLLALVLRLLTWAFFKLVYGRLEHPDSIQYHSLALSLLSSWKNGNWHLLVYPEYVNVVTVLYYIFSPNPIFPELLNVFLNSLLAPLSFILVRKFTSYSYAPWIAAILMAILPYEVYLSTQLLRDSLISLVLVGSLLGGWLGGLSFLGLGLLRYKLAFAFLPFLLVFFFFKRKAPIPLILVSLLLTFMYFPHLVNIVGTNEGGYVVFTDSDGVEKYLIDGQGRYTEAALKFFEQEGLDQDIYTGRSIDFKGEIQPPVTHTEFYSTRPGYFITSIIKFRVPVPEYIRNIRDTFFYPYPFEANNLRELGYVFQMLIWYGILVLFLVFRVPNSFLPLLLGCFSLYFYLTITTPATSTLVRWREPFFVLLIIIAFSGTGQVPLKRVIDKIVGLAFFISLLPLTTLIYLLLGQRPIFKQERVGLNGRRFTVYKFRTMFDNSEGKPVIGTDYRITKVGGFLRKYALDEIPQLVNLIKGDISIVGPRPLATWEHESLRSDIANWDRRLEVVPGMVGLAQINTQRWDNLEKLSWDLKYIDEPHNDFKIFMAGVKRIVRGRW